MAHRPAVTVGHLLVVVLVREHPLRGALEDGELLDVVGDRRRDLEPARAGADEREALAADVDVVGPAARSGTTGPAKSSMPGMSGRWGWFSAPTALITANASSWSTDPSFAFTSTVQRPVRVVERGARDLGVEPAVRLDAVLVHHSPEVLRELGLLREVLGPVVGRLERVAVEVAADVDPRAGVAVVPPRAAGTAALLHDRERDARLRQPDPGEQPGLAAPDHDDVRIGLHVVGDLVAPGDRARVRAVEMEVLEEHLRDVDGDVGAGDELHHLDEELERRRWRELAPAVAIRARSPARARRRTSAFISSGM